MTGLAQRLADLASSAMFDTALVSAVTPLAAGFVQVELTAEALRKATWVPGAKLRLRPRRGAFGLRTYTPISWDAERGVTRLLAYPHGDGPAARWFRQVAAGDTCEVFGPRRSIDLRGAAGAVVFVGDESSVALAVALRTVTGDVSHVFEAGDPDGLAEVLTGLGITDRVAVVAKAADRAELLRHARDAAIGDGYTLVVTGDAATVHAVRRDSRAWPHRPAEVKGKAYWAEGRTGLD
ncbi:siderophore-interacting protein [Dactylosporangium aurantiacum]|uniref:Siderophore-interacting protein n=1 Tax=Dactylosporangium aurantiacum TaxID=35754 RepID=A0A9Q9IC83_9ACTN|nr:siderophore-interacting protein [Dactylosporangium aurantiacum]MDG6110086.1 siderophore-interacting protein [Dactylosporangium aurantiacum]UWZ51337.1 siderophore-interacting protein [Dactylosporangium aurantiacum]